MATMTQQFREVVLRLASSADEQRAYLRKLGTAPLADELALEFSDLLPVVQDTLDESARRVARRLDEYLVGFSGEANAELWTVDALERAPEWTRVRDLANELLRHLDDPG